MEYAASPLRRVCLGCGESRPLGWFVKNGSGSLRAQCLECLKPKRLEDRARRREMLELARRERVTEEDIRQMGERQGWKCACGCGRDVRWEYHVDHRVPLAHGGEHVRGNLQLMRPTCNLRKGSRV